MKTFSNRSYLSNILRPVNSFSLNVIITFGVKVVSTAIGIATGIIVARALGPAGKGSFALITTFPALVFSFVHLGIAEANVYYLNKAKARVGVDIIRANTITLTLLISLFTILVLLILKSYILSTLLSNLSEWYFYIILLLIPFFIFETFGTSLLVAFERFKLIASIDFLMRIFDTAAVILVLFVFHLGLMGVILSFVSMFMLKCLLFFFYGFWRKPIRKRPDFGKMKTSIKFGFKSHAQSLTGVLHYKVDIYLVAAFLSAADVGYYSVAVALVSLIFFIPNSIGYVMFPKIAGFEDEEAHRFTAKACRNTLFVTMIPATGILILGNPMIRLLYGIDYLPACEALYLLIPGTLAMGIYKILTRNFTSRNRQQLTVVAGVVGLVLNIGFNLLLIPRLGIAGAALATTISYSTTSFLLLYFFLRESGSKLIDSLLIKPSDLDQMFRLISRGSSSESS